VSFNGSFLPQPLKTQASLQTGVHLLHNQTYPHAALLFKSLFFWITPFTVPLRTRYFSESQNPSQKRPQGPSCPTPGSTKDHPNPNPVSAVQTLPVQRELRAEARHTGTRHRTAAAASRKEGLRVPRWRPRPKHGHPRPSPPLPPAWPACLPACQGTAALSAARVALVTSPAAGRHAPFRLAPLLPLPGAALPLPVERRRAAIELWRAEQSVTAPPSWGGALHSALPPRAAQLSGILWLWAGLRSRCEVD